MSIGTYRNFVTFIRPKGSGKINEDFWYWSHLESEHCSLSHPENETKSLKITVIIKAII
jgi:hypothetical protein